MSALVCRVQPERMCVWMPVTSRRAVVDPLLAATAHVHGLTVATRHVSDYARTGVPTTNPFDTEPTGSEPDR